VPTPRREFLAQLATASLAVAGSACARVATSGVTVASNAPAASSNPPATTAPPTAVHFDDSWTTRVAAAKHKAVFDSPEVEDGRVLYLSWLYRDGYGKALGTPAADVVPVLVLRHAATVLAFDDALWAKYPIARLSNVKPSDAKKKDPWPTYNPYARPHTEAEKQYASFMLDGVLAAGAVVLACNTAFQGFSSRLAKEIRADVAQLREEMRARVVPGVIFQPSGIYATLRAQEVGCTFMRA